MIKVFRQAILPAALLAFLLTGCLERQFAESEVRLSANVGELVVPADMFEGPGLVKDTLVLTTNRSWSASFTEEVDWVVLGKNENLDLSHVSEEIRIPLKFKDNPSSEDRTAVLHFVSAEVEKDITIRQLGKVARLVFSGELSDERITEGERMYESSVRCEPDTCVVSFNANGNWTAKVLDGDAEVNLSKTSGTGNSSIKVLFGENEDSTAGKSAVIVISSEGCDDIRIHINQAVGTPYVKILSHDFPNINIPSIGARVTFQIKSNVAWTMKVKEGEELSAKFAVPVMETQDDGTETQKVDTYKRKVFTYEDEYNAKKGETSVVAAIMGNSDFDNDKTITLQLTAEGAEPAEVTLTVDKLRKVLLTFRKWPDVFSDKSTSVTWYQPFNIDMFGSSSCGANDFTWEALNGYQFRMHTFGTVYPENTKPTGRMCVNSAGGLNLGTSYNMVYITLPAVPGRKLSKVTLMNGGISTNRKWATYGIYPMSYVEEIEAGKYPTQKSSETPNVNNFTMVTGGDPKYPTPPVRKDITYENPEDDMAKNPTSYITYELQGTEVNTSYAIISSYSIAGMKWIELIYE